LLPAETSSRNPVAQAVNFEDRNPSWPPAEGDFALLETGWTKNGKLSKTMEAAGPVPVET
jgi:hypothetical protein